MCVSVYMCILQIFYIFVLLCFLCVNEASEAEFLASHRRFSDSNSYDSYYSCNMCGSVLIWLIDGVYTLRHFTSQSTVGSIQNVASSTESLSYTSIVLSQYQNDSSINCMNVILIATQTYPDWRPSVICRGADYEHVVKYSSTIVDQGVAEIQGSVTGRLAVIQRNVVGSDFITGLIVCRSTDSSISWTENGTFIAGYNGGSIPGDNAFQRYPTDPNVILWGTMVLEKKAEEITSLIVGNGRPYDVSQTHISVGCHSRLHKVIFVLNGEDILENISSEGFGSIQDNLSAINDSAISNDTAISNSKSLLPCMFSYIIYNTVRVIIAVCHI